MLRRVDNKKALLTISLTITPATESRRTVPGTMDGLTCYREQEDSTRDHGWSHLL